jgi:phosphoribosyl-AMP cyclohydrolase
MVQWKELFRFDEQGLLPTIVQDAASGEVLMFAYMNEEALQRTLTTGFAHFWSRTRKQLWQKGEVSGHTQAVVEVRCDCDPPDAVLVRVYQKGGACHTGYRSCFYRHVDAEGNLHTVGQRVFDPERAYGEKAPPARPRPSRPGRRRVLRKRPKGQKIS